MPIYRLWRKETSEPYGTERFRPSGAADVEGVRDRAAEAQDEKGYLDQLGAERGLRG